MTVDNEEASQEHIEHPSHDKTSKASAKSHQARGLDRKDSPSTPGGTNFHTPTSEPASYGFTGHHLLRRLNTELLNVDRGDIEKRYKLEEDDNTAQAAGPHARVMVSFSPGDPENPVNWSTVRLSTTNGVTHV